MRNILEKVRERDYDAVNADAQAIYLADGRAGGREAGELEEGDEQDCGADQQLPEAELLGLAMWRPATRRGPPHPLRRTPGPGRRARLLPAMAKRVSLGGQAIGARLARTAGLLPIPQAPVAQAARHPQSW